MSGNAGANHDNEAQSLQPPDPLVSKEDKAKGAAVFQSDGFVWYWPPGGTEWELLVTGPAAPAHEEPEKPPKTSTSPTGIKVPAGGPRPRPRPGRDARRDVMPAPGEVRRRAR